MKLKKVSNLNFVFDFRFCIDKDGNAYGPGQFSYNNLWKTKYLTMCNNLNVIARLDESVKKEICISGKSVNFIATYNMASINIIKNAKKNYKILYPVLENGELTIVRLPSLQGLLACRILQKLKKKYVIEVVGSAFESYWYHDKFKGKLMAPIIELATKRTIKKAKNVTYVTNEYLQKKYPNKYNAISFSDVKIDLDETAIDANKKKFLQARKYKLGLVGPLNVMYKGHKTAIKILSLLCKDYDCELHFLGSGDFCMWKNYAKKYGVSEYLFQDDIRSSGEEMNEWYDIINILLIPSLTEGMPRVCIEAMARGIPIVSSNVGELEFLLNHKNTFSKKDYKGMAKRIKNLFTDKTEAIKDIDINYKKCYLFSNFALNEKRNDYYQKIIGDDANE